MQRIGKFSLFFVLFFGLLSFADVRVETLLDRNQLQVGDNLLVTVSVVTDQTVDITEPRVPNLTGFELVNAWTTNSRSSKLAPGPNGLQFKNIRRQNYHYSLTAIKNGRLTIDSFQVNVDGQMYHTKPVVIFVGGNSGRGQGYSQGQGGGTHAQAPSTDEDLMQQGDSTSDSEKEADELFNQLLENRLHQAAGKSAQYRTLPNNMNEAYFIQVEVDKTEAYVGEQILVKWYILVRGLLEQLDRVTVPTLKGFWKEDIDQAPTIQYTQEVINGVSYRKALIGSYALFPMKEGSAEIDRYVLKCVVRMDGPMGFGQPFSYTKSSLPIKIKVKPLPSEGKPADFTGAVGVFNVKSTAEGSPFYVNQPFSFKIRFDGIGNAKLIDLPAIDYPVGLELYDTKKEARYEKSGRSYKEFEVLIIPRQEGEFTLPAFSVSYFDTAKKEYVKRSTESIKIKVLPDKGGGQQNFSNLGANKTTATPVRPREDVLPDIETSWKSGYSFSFSQRLSIWLIVYLVILLALSYKAHIELGWGQRQKSTKSQIVKRFKLAYNLLAKSESRKAATEVMNTVYFTLGNVTGEGGAHVELAKLFENSHPSVRKELETPVTELMQSLEIIAFAPEAIQGEFTEKKKIKTLFQRMEKLMTRALALKA